MEKETCIEYVNIQYMSQWKQYWWKSSFYWWKSARTWTKFILWYLLMIIMNENPIIKWKFYWTFSLFGPKDYRNFLLFNEQRTRLIAVPCTASCAAGCTAMCAAGCTASCAGPRDAARSPTNSGWKSVKRTRETARPPSYLSIETSGNCLQFPEIIPAKFRENFTKNAAISAD